MQFPAATDNNKNMRNKYIEKRQKSVNVGKKQQFIRFLPEDNYDDIKV